MKNTLFFFALILSTTAWPLSASALDTPASGTTYSYPLPAKVGGAVNVVYTMASSGTAQIIVYNLSGVSVINFTDYKNVGLQSSAIDLCCLAPGVYLYLVTLNYDSGNQEKLSAGKLVVTN
jgi:hypothetical protein